LEEKIIASIGVYAAIINNEEGKDFGKLLLYRRTATTSINEGVSYRGNFELPGRAMLTTEGDKYGYNHAALTVEKAVLDRAGIRIFLSKMPAFYTVFLGNEKTRDQAMVTIYHEPHPRFTFADSGDDREVIWVDTETLHTLAQTFEPANEAKGISGKGLLSGKGKRMHCMALMGLTQSPKQEYAMAAMKELQKIQEIQADWPVSL